MQSERWQRIKPWLLGLLLALTACDKQSPAGNTAVTAQDFGQFFQDKGAEYGLHFRRDPTHPLVSAHWNIQTDTTGFILHVTGVKFDEVDQILQAGLGKPVASEETDLTGQPHRVWAASDVGAAVQAMGEPGGLQIICVRSTPAPKPEPTPK